MRFLFVLLLLFFSIPNVLNAEKTSLVNSVAKKDLELHLITVAPGKGFSLAWAWWGHTALLILDKKNNTNIIFDYGLFAGIGSSFVYEYFEGKPVFFLGLSTLEKTLFRYRLQNRAVFSQKIVASSEKINLLYKKLLDNAREENRNYHYNHFYNNCTTIVRDLLDEFIFEGEFKKKYQNLASSTNIRIIAIAPFSILPPAYVLINYFSGFRATRQMDLWETMFTPKFLLDALIGFQTSNAKVEKEKVLFASSLPTNQIDSRWFSWFFYSLFYALTFFFLYVYPLRKKNKNLEKKLGRIGKFLFYPILACLGSILYLFYFYYPNNFFGYNIVGYNPHIHAIHPFYFLYCLFYFIPKKFTSRKSILEGLEYFFFINSFYAFLLALFLAHYSIILLGTISLAQASLIYQNHLWKLGRK